MCNSAPDGINNRHKGHLLCARPVTRHQAIAMNPCGCGGRTGPTASYLVRRKNGAGSARFSCWTLGGPAAQTPLRHGEECCARGRPMPEVRPKRLVSNGLALEGILPWIAGASVA